MDTLTECWPLVTEIGEQLKEKRERHDEIIQEIEKLQEAGVFDQIPSESWETRNGGETKYLRLVFPTNNGRRRRVYVGCDPAKIARASEKIGRTHRLRDLQAEERRLSDHAIRAKTYLRQALLCLKGKPLW
jgi:hypothetical protein